MRAGLSTIQQTLTPEAASLLNNSIAEANRRNHSQTTPLHVGATLLASPSGFLRQACIRSHPNSSHPLQSRALELCFSVALERLPTAQHTEAPAMEPPISNALVAALKRAQAHQRRGCPEQQQQPLLAVKVELDQLIVSILDDPSVSRVMREASFSSPAVKAAIEKSLNCSTSHVHHQSYISAEGMIFGSSFALRPDRSSTPVVQSPSPANPRLGTERPITNPVESLNPLKALPTPLSENLNSTIRTTFCTLCSENYEKELAKLTAIEKSFREATQDATRSSLPQWLRNAKLNAMDAKKTDQSQVKDRGLLSTQKTRELQKKWRDTCLNLHPNFHQNSKRRRPSPPALSMTSLCDPNLLARIPFHTVLPAARPLLEAPHLNLNQASSKTAWLSNSPPGSPVETDLVLGRKETRRNPERVCDAFANALDADTYKKLLKGLMEKAWWQAEAASAVASAICQRSRKCRKAGSRGDRWLLFTGPDRVGKKKMASVLAEQRCGDSAITICLSRRRDEEEPDSNSRGRTAMDRIAEAVRRDPFSIIMLEDIDKADMLVRGNIRRAIERGRLADSHGREVGLGSAIFILTGDWSSTNLKAFSDGQFVDEKKLAFVASGNWQLGIAVREKSAKRSVTWLSDEERPLKPLKEQRSGLSFDLNLALADTKDDRSDGSHDSSDLTVYNDEELSTVNPDLSITSVPQDLLDIVDASIMFKPVDSALFDRRSRRQSP